MSDIDEHIYEDIINDFDSIPIFAISDYHVSGEDRQLYICALFVYDNEENRELLLKYFQETFPYIDSPPHIYTRVEVLTRYAMYLPHFLLDRRLGRGYYCTWSMHLTTGL
jgi:hypothetical protein